MTRATQKVELTIVAHIEADMVTADNGVGHVTAEPENPRLVAFEVGGLVIPTYNNATKRMVIDFMEVEAFDAAGDRAEWETDE